MRTARKSNRVLALGAVVALAGGLVTMPVASADAAVLPTAITNVQLRETAGNQWTTYHVDINWALPAGAQEGDTFSITLPPEMRAVPQTAFDLNDTASGKTIAKGLVTGFQTLSFTVQKDAEGLMNITGSAFVQVTMSSNVATGSNLPLTFTTTSGDFTDSMTWNGVAMTDSWSKWGNAYTAATKNLQWGVVLKRADSLPYKYILQDHAPADGSWTFDCSTPVNIYGWPTDRNVGTWQWMAGGVNNVGITVNCSPTYLQVDFEQTNIPRYMANGIPMKPEILFNAIKTDPSRPVYTNNNAKVINKWGNDVPLSTTASYPAAGGVANGDLLAVKKYSGTLAAGDFNVAPGLQTEAGKSTPVTIVVTNGGSTTQNNVVITDDTKQGAALDNLQCTTHNGTTYDAANGVVNIPVALPSGRSIVCDGTLPALADDEQHENVVTVTSVGNAQLTASDPFFAKGPAPVVVDPGPKPADEVVPGAWTVTTAATCDAEGVESRTVETFTYELENNAWVRKSAGTTMETRAIPRLTTGCSVPPVVVNPPVVNPPVVNPPVVPPPVVISGPTPTPTPSTPETPKPVVPPHTPPVVIAVPRPPVTLPPRARITKELVQMDAYRWGTRAERARIMNYNKDGKLVYREDREQWKDSTWRMVEVTRTNGKITAARVIKTGGRGLKLKKSDKVIHQNYALNKRATVRHPWGANRKLAQRALTAADNAAIFKLLGR